MYNQIDGIFNRQTHFNYGNEQQGSHPVTPESKGKNRKTTACQVTDHRGLFLNESNSSTAHYSSTAVQQRAVEPQQSINEPARQDLYEGHPTDFDNLLVSSQLIEIKRKEKIFGNQYTGKSHSIYALFINQFVQYHQPLNTDQLNKLLLLIKTHDPKPYWMCRSLTTAFHAWTFSGLFTHNECLSQKAQNIQVVLLERFLDKILNSGRKDNSPQDISARGVTNVLSAMAKLVDNGLKLEDAPQLKEVTIVVWKHVRIIAKNESKKEEYCLSPREISHLMNAMVELWDCGLHAIKNTQDLKDTVVTLLTLMETKARSKANKNHLKALDVAYIVRSIVQMMNNGLLTDVTKLNESLSVLLFLVVKHKDQFVVQSLSHILWAIMELECCDRLNLKNRQNLKGIIVTLLPCVITQAKENKDSFYAYHVSNILYFIVKMLEYRLLISESLNDLVATLLPIAVEHRNSFSTPNLSQFLCTMSKLACRELTKKNRQMIQDTMAFLLPCAEIKLESKEEIDHFTPQGNATLLWIVAKLSNNKKKLTLLKLNKFVALLLPLIIVQKDEFSPASLRNVVWAMAKLVSIDNMAKSMLNMDNTKLLESTVVILLPLLKTKVESQKEEDRFALTGIASLVWAFAKLAQVMQPLHLSKIKEIVNALLFQVEAQEDPFTSHSIASMLWAVSALGELIEIQRAVSLSVYLANTSQIYTMFVKKEKMMSLWGFLVCRGRLFLSGSVEGSDILQHHIKQLFSLMKNEKFEIKEDEGFEIEEDERLEIHTHKTIMAMASSWLGEPCCSRPDYREKTSQYQRNVYKALSEKCPFLTMEVERTLLDLPPVDLYLPDHNIVVEVQGPYHYICGDFQTRNGSTLLKMALLKKQGYDVIEIIMFSFCESSSIQKGIDKIQQKIESAEAIDDCSISSISESVQESSDDEYFTANEDDSPDKAATDKTASDKAATTDKAATDKAASDKAASDKLCFNDTHRPTETGQETDWQFVVPKKKKSRRKAKK